MSFKKLMVAALFLSFPFVSHAKIPNWPYDQCPSVTSVQALTSNFKVREYEEGSNVWFAYLNNAFDTPYVWTFLIQEVHANNSDDARKKLLDSLAGLSLKAGPDYGDDGSMDCHYRAPIGMRASAGTPTILSGARLK